MNNCNAVVSDCSNTQGICLNCLYLIIDDYFHPYQGGFISGIQGVH